MRYATTRTYKNWEVFIRDYWARPFESVGNFKILSKTYLSYLHNNA